MRRFRLFALLALVLMPAIGDAVAVHSFQVTIGAGTTQVWGTQLLARQIFFQNNAAHTMRIGDVTVSSSKGVLLAVGPPGGSLTVGVNVGGGDIDLSTFWVNGTNGDVLDVSYVQ